MSERVAVISDVHGNARALEAVLADLDARRPDLIVVGGDVPFGPRPAETLDRLLERAYPTIMGNTDLWIAQVYGGQGDRVPPGALPLVSWCASRLRAPQVAALEVLPDVWRREPREGATLLVVHATPTSLLDAVMPEDPEERFRQMLREGGDPAALAYGHVHRAFQLRVDGRLIANTGSVGLPQDGDPRASYAVFTWDGAWSVEHRRIAYDVEAAVADLYDSGFPWASEWEPRCRTGRPA